MNTDKAPPSEREAALPVSQGCGHKTLHCCPGCKLCFACCQCVAFGEELGIHFHPDVAEDGEGCTAWEVPADPEPLYFETLREAVKGYIDLLSKECDRLQARAAVPQAAALDVREFAAQIGQLFTYPNLPDGDLVDECVALLVRQHLRSRAAAVPAPGNETDDFVKKVVHFRASCITGSECQDALQELANEAERILVLKG